MNKVRINVLTDVLSQWPLKYLDFSPCGLLRILLNNMMWDLIIVCSVDWHTLHWVVITCHSSVFQEDCVVKSRVSHLRFRGLMFTFSLIYVRFYSIKKLDHKIALIRMLQAWAGGKKNENKSQLILLLSQDWFLISIITLLPGCWSQYSQN